MTSAHANNLWAPSHTLLMLVFGSFSSGCAQQTEIIRLYENPDYRGQTFNRLLVVEVSNQPDERRRFEQALTDVLELEGVSAFASSLVTPSEPIITPRVNLKPMAYL